MEIIRLVVAFAGAFALSALFTALEIPLLIKKQMGQNIREEGPESHKKKAGTPSMGGVALVLALVVTALAVGGGFRADMVFAAVVTVLFAATGFLDDYIKVIRKNNLGLRAWQKLLLQIIIAVITAFWAAGIFGTQVYIPFADTYVDFGDWYIPFVAFAVVAMTNAVNLTDGLDGLAAGCTLLTGLFFGLSAAMLGSMSAGVFGTAIAGACMGFLMFNRNPARVFMGDTGSLALGGALSAVSIMTGMELMLIIVGLVYVIEVVSVIIQVVAFQTTGKRVFRMTPLHHHFELGGMSERKVVVMFWIFTLLCCLAGFLVIGL